MHMKAYPSLKKRYVKTPNSKKKKKKNWTPIKTGNLKIFGHIWVSFGRAACNKKCIKSYSNQLA